MAHKQIGSIDELMQLYRQSQVCVDDIIFLNILLGEFLQQLKCIHVVCARNSKGFFRNDDLFFKQLDLASLKEELAAAAAVHKTGLFVKSVVGLEVMCEEGEKHYFLVMSYLPKSKGWQTVSGALRTNPNRDFYKKVCSLFWQWYMMFLKANLHAKITDNHLDNFMIHVESECFLAVDFGRVVKLNPEIDDDARRKQQLKDLQEGLKWRWWIFKWTEDDDLCSLCTTADASDFDEFAAAVELLIQETSAPKSEK